MTPHFPDTERRTKSVTTSRVTNEERTAMERKDRFLAAWNEQFEGSEPPDLEFGDDSLGERRNLCSKQLQDALSVIKREGFVLNWINDVLSIENGNDEDPNLGRILQILFDKSTGKDLSSKTENGAELPSPSKENPSKGEHNAHQRNIYMSQQGDSVIFDVCDTSVGIPDGNIDTKASQINTFVDVPGSGSTLIAEEDSCPNVGSELFKAINEVGENETTAAESDQGSTHDGTKNVGQELKEPEPSTQSAELAKDQPSVRILESPKTLCNSCLSPDVMSQSQTTEDSNEKATLVEENRAECGTLVQDEGHGLVLPSIVVRRASHDGLKTIEKELNGSEACAESQQDSEKTPAAGHEPQSHTERGNAEVKGYDGSAEDEEACTWGPTLDESVREIDDAMSFLDTVEMISSDEEDSPCDDTILGMTRRGKRYGSDFRSRKLDSIRSVGNASIMSMDSCVAPWALDVAASEMHSADSSDENVVDQENSNAKRKISDKKSPSVDGAKGLADLKEAGYEEFNVPTRPPRRSRKERKARTVGSPRRVCILGDDDVFKREDDGYEGDREGKPTADLLGGNHVRTRSHGDTDHRKKRKARGSDVVFDGSNVDFTSSPIGSPEPRIEKQIVDEYDEDDAQKLHKRKWVVSAVLDSEKGYLECLNLLVQHMRPLRLTIGTASQVLTSSEFDKIFYKVEEIHGIHTKFYNDLEQRVSNWSVRQIIGDLFLALTFQSDVYKEYIGNYGVVLQTIHKCKSNNEQFQDIFCKELKLQSLQEVSTLEGLFSKPVDRIGRYITNLNDLIKHTPEEHPDYPLLKDVRQTTEDFLAHISGDQRDAASGRVKKDHRLIKDAFIVDLADGVRKIRHLFLFNDVMLCTKRKISGRNEAYICKWFIPMSEVQFHRVEDSDAPQVVPVTSQTDLDVLKGRIASTKAEIRRERGTALSRSPDTSPSLKRKRILNSKIMEKLQKKLAEQEVDLLLATPSLPLTLYSKQGKTYTLLCKSDVERAEWKDAITLEKEVAAAADQSNSPITMIEIQAMLETCKKLRTCKTLGRVSLKQDKTLLSGLLYVHIQTGRGFHQGDLYCVVEVDHYGQFTRKAKTKTCKASTDPVWDQDFDIEVEGTKEIKLLVYCKSRLKDDLCGQGRIQLRRENLDDLQKRTITITLDKQGAVTLSLQYSNSAQGIERKKSLSEKGVFGVDLATVARREASDIPLVVIGCVQEIEKRGLDEVGIYRLSGASTDLRKLKEAFDENSQSALVQVAESDIHAVAGLLKMYLRDLPEPLLTDRLYNEFVTAKAITDGEEKKKRMVELFESLETPNRLTTIYLVEHLRLVSTHEENNKMSMNNLATVFGPNVLRPSSSGSEYPMDLAQGTLNVMSQVSIFLYLLKLDSDATRLPKDRPGLLRRLDPKKTPDSFQGPDLSANQDRLI